MCVWPKEETNKLHTDATGTQINGENEETQRKDTSRCVILWPLTPTDWIALDKMRKSGPGQTRLSLSLCRRITFV